MRRLPSRPDSELALELAGFRPPAVADQYLAQLVDLAAAANWQRVGKRGAPRPKPVERPWARKKSQRLGAEPIPVRDFHAWWDSVPLPGNDGGPATTQ